MADPTIGAITTFDSKVSTLDNGAAREFWIRIPGLSAASDQDSGGNDDLYYLLNPFPEDMVILNALAVVTTLDANDGNLDVGLANDAEGTSVGAEIIDSLDNSAAGVYECTVVQAPAGGAKAIWRVAGTATDSYLVITQNTDADASDLRWHLLLKLIPYADLIGDEGTQAAVTVA